MIAMYDLLIPGKSLPCLEIFYEDVRANAPWIVDAENIFYEDVRANTPWLFGNKFSRRLLG